MRPKFWNTALMLTAAAALIAPPSFSCCSMFPAKFGNTRGVAAEGTYKGKLVHVLGYQNIAENDNSGPNALFLPIPAKPGTMTQASILDTKKYPNVVKDITNAIPIPVPRAATFGKSKADTMQAQAIVFDHGIYTIVLANDAKAIPAALAKVPHHKRPAMNNAIFEAYSKWYPGWTFALCCFNTKDKADGGPMVWVYEPMYQDRLFFPALDAHDGKPPDLNEMVALDHLVAFGSRFKDIPDAADNEVLYSTDFPPDVKELFPLEIYGQKFERPMKNGDFWVDLTKFTTQPSIDRRPPPGAGKRTASR